MSPHNAQPGRSTGRVRAARVEWVAAQSVVHAGVSVAEAHSEFPAYSLFAC
eukprot:CAMPEP_0114165140 /NCGR_PEP_ID=MMETSP0043_2-20121206/31079_1 /TAXON_ID=464988 /ORGANISM="Hemiselmis andersenii, Strain CCMP644" /LENGTH=50 /DNA_ID=CAMNT_0001261921 /DNA_START=14 /DNA_END=163 /DNA_ORIENTATION=+